MLGERREYTNWPRVRQLKNGRVQVRGRVRTVGRYLLVMRLLRGALMILILLLLASASQGVWFDLVPRGTIAFGLSQDLLAVRWWLNNLAETHPDVAAKVFYSPVRPINWHVLGLAFVVGLLGRALMPLLGSLLALPKRFVCTIGPDRVAVRCGLRRIRLSRRDLSRPVMIRAVDADAWHAKRAVERLAHTSPLGEHAHPPAIVEAVQGGHRRRVVFALRADRAEALASRCDEALRQTANLIKRK